MSQNSSPLPPQLFESHSMNVTINYLHNSKLHPMEDWEAAGKASLMGHILPPFQRPLVWEEDRMIAFIESAYLGISLGSWVYNEWYQDAKTIDGVDHLPETHMWLIDGQQRLTALDRYFDDAFPVFGKLWSELDRKDQRRFLFVSFPANKIESPDPDFLRVVYDRLNFGGVAHTIDQRATTDEELEQYASPKR